MKVVPDHIVRLGYGKYFRSDYIVGLEPVEEGRGPGSRTRVYVEGIAGAGNGFTLRWRDPQGHGRARRRRG